MITTRDYQPADLAACLDLYLRVFREPPWHEEWDPADAQAHLEQISGTPGFLGLLAEDDGAVIGVLLGVEKRGSTSGAFILDDMFIAPTHQRRGVGSQLMDELKRALRSRGVHTMGLLMSWMAPGADFYHAQGFEEVPVLRFLRYDLDTPAS